MAANFGEATTAARAVEAVVADLEGLLSGTDFVPRVHALLTLLAEHLGTPVDIEFAHDGEQAWLLQCRPQAVSGEAAPAAIPRDVPAADLLFTAHPDLHRLDLRTWSGNTRMMALAQRLEQLDG